MRSPLACTELACLALGLTAPADAAKAATAVEAMPAARKAEVAAWTREYSARRAGYYLADARKMLDKAMKHYVMRRKGGTAPDPYLKIWDAQSQLSAALSWDNQSAELWLEAGNLSFSLAGLMREIEEGDLLQDALAFWGHALQLEAGAEARLAPSSRGAAATGPPSRPLARRLLHWLREVVEAAPAELRRRLPQRLWLQVRKEAWEKVRHWGEGGEATGSPLALARTLKQRRPGRVEALAALAVPAPSCTSELPADEASCAVKPTSSTGASANGGGWLEKKLGAGREVLFPTYVYRTNILKELGRPLFEKLSEVAARKYSEFRKSELKRHRREHGSMVGLEETRINDAFFQFQETHEHALRSPEVQEKWPELYASEEFQKIVTLARDASVTYLQHSGTKVTPEEMESSWVIIWTAVYPQDPGTQGRHGWHTHQESVVSGVLYANPCRTPLLFADPRGAPPIEDYEQYRAADLVFEPKAPFDANYQLFAEPGELVLFPSWLVHKVPPPIRESGPEFRVVFPFNFHLGTGRHSRANIWDGWERTVPVVAAPI